MKLYLAQTGDMSITMLISTFSLGRAIDIANRRYKKEYDDGSGFEYDNESVVELIPSQEECIIEVFQNETI